MKYSPETNLFTSHSESSFLPQIIWVVTDNCPNNCSFCFQPKYGNDFPKSQLREVVSKLKALGVQKVDISGGEPLNYEGLEFFCYLLAEQEIYFTITSMGSSSSSKEWLFENWKLFSRILVSLNGGISVHDKLAGKKGAFERALELLSGLKGAGCSRLRVNSVVTKFFLEKAAQDEILEQVCDLSPREWCLIEPNPDNTGDDFGEVSITSTQFFEVYDSISQRMEERGVTLLTRTIDDYASYWVLNPDGGLFKHAARGKTPLWRGNAVENSLGELKEIISGGEGCGV